MTSAIPVQRSNQLSYQANWELVNCELKYLVNCELKYFSCNSKKGDRARGPLVRESCKQHKKYQ